MERCKGDVPKISIVTICYNACKDLEKTIHSVKSLLYPNKEYIIIDGGSDDGSKEVILRHEQWITYWVSERDYGIYDAMNKGIAQCSGEWIIFMNAGDVFHNESVLNDVFCEHFEENIGILYGDVNLIFPKIGNLIKCFKYTQQDAIPYEICHQGVFTRTRLLKKIQYDTSFKIMADLDSFLRIYQEGYLFAYVAVVIADFDIVGGISSLRPLVSHREMMRLRRCPLHSMAYVSSLGHAIIKWICMRLLPQPWYNKLRYSKLLRMKRYVRN